MRLTVVYYGGLKQMWRQARDARSAARHADGPRAERAVARAASSLASRLHTVAVAVNDALVESDYVLQDGDEASSPPPVSGGEHGALGYGQPSRSSRQRRELEDLAAAR